MRCKAELNLMNFEAFCYGAEYEARREAKLRKLKRDLFTKECKTIVEVLIRFFVFYVKSRRSVMSQFDEPDKEHLQVVK